MVLPTIVAVSTAFGLSGVGVVRVSGTKVKKICLLIIKKRLRPRYALCTNFYDNNNFVLDKGIAIFFPKPNSFTGEDVLEFHCHGNPLILHNLVSSIIYYGAIEAKPGEFTQRSFLNGKIDLLQAESIYNLIDAQNSTELSAALNNLDGNFSKKIKFLYNEFYHLYTYLEVENNFSEIFQENYFFNLFNYLLKDLIYALNKILVETYFTLPLYTGNTLIIIGKPNVGKSSLFNLLLKKDRSITSTIPGTTRDLLSEQFTMFNQKLTIIDTAGLNFFSNDFLELEGIKKAKNALKDSHIVLILLDASTDLNCLIYDKKILFPELCSSFRLNSRFFYVVNKIDLLSSIEKSKLKKNKDVIYISTKTGEGVQELRKCLLKSIELFKVATNENFLKDRHLALLLKIRCSLQHCIFYLSDTINFHRLLYEFYLIDCDFLKLIGKIYDKSILDTIFLKFCVGK